MTASPWDTRAGLLSPPPGRQFEEGQTVRGQHLQSYGPQSQVLLAALHVLKTASRSPVLRKAGSYPASRSKNFCLGEQGPLPKLQPHPPPSCSPTKWVDFAERGLRNKFRTDSILTHTKCI